MIKHYEIPSIRPDYILFNSYNTGSVFFGFRNDFKRPEEAADENTVAIFKIKYK